MKNGPRRGGEVYYLNSPDVDSGTTSSVNYPPVSDGNQRQSAFPSPPGMKHNTNHTDITTTTETETKSKSSTTDPSSYLSDLPKTHQQSRNRNNEYNNNDGGMYDSAKRKPEMYLLFSFTKLYFTKKLTFNENAVF